LEPTTVTAHSPETDLQPIKSDLTALALREATNEASAAFNLPNQFIETFSDDTNLGTQTTGDRTSGYWATVYSSVGKFTSDSNTSFLLHSDTTDGSTTFTDSSSNGHTVSNSGTIAHSTNFFKSELGTSSIRANGSHRLYIAHDAGWNFATGDFCIEWWQYSDGTLTTGDRIIAWGNHPNNHETYCKTGMNTSNWWTLKSSDGTNFNANSFGSEPSEDAWCHFAVCRDVNNLRIYINGVQWTAGNHPMDFTGKSTFTESHSLNIFDRTNTGEQVQDMFYLTELRISKGTSRYPSGTTFTPNAIATASATGTLIQSANAVGGSDRTKVGGTMLYKDNEGTATLGSANDLAIYFTCDGGSNWTEAASYNAITPVYSTGVKQVRLGETTCTSGTDVRYKAVWANQSSGSKETQLHGIGLNY
jgi:hypothetical protein